MHVSLFFFPVRNFWLLTQSQSPNQSSNHYLRSGMQTCQFFPVIANFVHLPCVPTHARDRFWQVALSPASVLFVTGLAQKKPAEVISNWSTREDGGGDKARMNQWYSWNCMWIKGGVSRYFESLYISWNWALFFFCSFLIYLPGNYGWSSFAFIQVSFQLYFR